MKTKKESKGRNERAEEIVSAAWKQLAEPQSLL